MTKALIKAKKAPAKKKSPRFTKLNSAFKPTNATNFKHRAVLDSQTGLIWAADPIKVDNWKQAEDLAKKFSEGGVTDWRMPTMQELFSIADHTKSDPAIDTKYFRMPKKGEWLRFWSSSPVVGWPEGAWLVLFDSGGVNYSDRYGSGFVRPVRVARARQ